MRDLTKFQLIVLAVFAIFIVVGVIVFAVKGVGSNAVSELTIWGTMSQEQFNDVLTLTGLKKNEEFEITYVEKRKERFDIEFLEALASNRAPDLFFLSSDSVLKHKERSFIIPFKTFSERAFLDSFAENTEVFLSDEGIIALPIFMDPLVMYWNRDIFSSSGLVKPPKFWEEFYDLSAFLTQKDGALNITRGTVALGEYMNITNAFEILSTLIMQAGSPISLKQGEIVISVLDKNMGLPAVPAERALSFYTDFSNSLKPFYSWNRSLRWSKDYFTDGDLAVYFGFASELFDIEDKNPNLNFDMTTIPQSRESERRLTYGKVEGLAISKISNNIESAFKLASILSGRDSAIIFSQVKNLPPARRDLLAQKPDRAYWEIFYEGAIISRAWLVPDREVVNEIFRNMVESVTGGRVRPKESVDKASLELNLLFSDSIL